MTKREFYSRYSFLELITTSEHNKDGLRAGGLGKTEVGGDLAYPF